MSGYQINGHQIGGYQIASYQIGVTKNPPEVITLVLF